MNNWHRKFFLDSHDHGRADLGMTMADLDYACMTFDATKLFHTDFGGFSYKRFLRGFS
jgi:hypothetical protein